jgi:hypothetical protein
MRKFFGPMGSVSRVTIESHALKSNMRGVPSARAVDVYTPAGHDGQGLPLLVDLVGFTSSGLSQTNWVGFRENLPERFDRLIGKERMPPIVGSISCSRKFSQAPVETELIYWLPPSRVKQSGKATTTGPDVGVSQRMRDGAVRA